MEVSGVYCLGWSFIVQGSFYLSKCFVCDGGVDHFCFVVVVSEKLLYK